MKNSSCRDGHRGVATRELAVSVIKEITRARGSNSPGSQYSGS
jgi:hypothetical protein